MVLTSYNSLQLKQLKNLDEFLAVISIMLFKMEREGFIVKPSSENYFDKLLIDIQLKLRSEAKSELEQFLLDKPDQTAINVIDHKFKEVLSKIDFVKSKSKPLLEFQKLEVESDGMVSYNHMDNESKLTIYIFCEIEDTFYSIENKYLKYTKHFPNDQKMQNKRDFSMFEAALICFYEDRKMNEETYETEAKNFGFNSRTSPVKFKRKYHKILDIKERTGEVSIPRNKTDRIKSFQKIIKHLKGDAKTLALKDFEQAKKCNVTRSSHLK